MNRNGATLEEWVLWSETLGLYTELLPVVCNATSRISPKSKLSPGDLCRVPSVYNEVREVTGITEWTTLKPKSNTVQRWMTERDYGIGLQTRDLWAIDIDIDNASFVSKIMNAIKVVLSKDYPFRYRADSARRLILLKPEAPMKYRRFGTGEGAIEFLGLGKQCVIAGTHHRGTRYQWAGPLAQGIPSITNEQVELLLALLREVCGDDLDESEARGTERNALTIRGDPNDPVLQHLDIKSYGAEGEAYIVCPFASEHTKDSGETSTVYYTRGSRGYQQGHFKCLHAHCAGRTDDEFLDAIGFRTQGFSIIPAEKSLPKLVMNPRTGEILSNANNLALGLGDRRFGGCLFSRDVFLGRDVIQVTEDGPWRPIEEEDYFDVKRYMENRGFKEIGPQLLRSAIASVARGNPRDSAMSWLTGLKWDGIPRAETFFIQYIGTEDSPYTRAAGRYLWTALAGRCLHAGTRASMIPILIGPQGPGKGEVIRAISPAAQYFKTVSFNMDFREIVRSLKGKLVGEVPELDGLHTRELESIKAFVDDTTDQYRVLYEETIRDYHRRWVLLGSANNIDILVDTTGNRRWLPMNVGSIHPELVRRDCEQLWAEGREMFSLHGVLWKEAQHEASKIHDDFRAIDIWEIEIRHWASRQRFPIQITMRALINDVFQMDPMRVGHRDQVRLGKILRCVGFTKEKLGTKSARGWVWVLKELKE